MDPVWSASLVDASARTMLFDDTAVFPDDRALAAAAARTRFTAGASTVRRWRLVASHIAAEHAARLQVWVSVRIEGDLVPVVRLRWGGRNDGPEVRLERPAGITDEYVRALLCIVDAPSSDATLELEGLAGADRGSGALWWDALWMEPDDARTPAGTVLIGVPEAAERVRQGRIERGELPLPGTELPLPGLPEPAASTQGIAPTERTSPKPHRGRRILGMSATAAAVAAVVVAAGATAGIVVATRKPPKSAPPAANGGTTQTSPPASGGSGSTKIVFVSARDRQRTPERCGGGVPYNDIYVYDGAAVRRVTNMLTEPEADQTCNIGYADPEWSPDGSKIIARRFFGSSSQLTVMNADGSGITIISPDEAHVSRSAWSPDGATIAYVGRDVRQAIRLVAPDGSNLRTVPNTADAFDLAFAPDSKTIAFIQGEDLFTISTDGSGLRKIGLVGSRRQPAFSPDGTQIAIADQEGIYAMSLDGTQRKIADVLGTESSPSWTADGRWVVFGVEVLDPLASDIYVVGADGTGLTRLTQSGVDYAPDSLGSAKPEPIDGVTGLS